MGEFSDLLDLRTVLKWKDEVGIKRGIYLRMERLNLMNIEFRLMGLSSICFKMYSNINSSVRGSLRTITSLISIEDNLKVKNSF